MNRRDFLAYSSKLALASTLTPLVGTAAMDKIVDQSNDPTEFVTLFLCGDVMTGRGIDQVLPYPSKPQLYEPYVSDAMAYVELAEKLNGPISKPVPYEYIWGDALDVLARIQPAVRIINLETSVTTNDEYWRGKGINYRMHPKNIFCITAANIDCCVLANNHVLDWGYSGLEETLQTLRGANLKPVGAGRNISEAGSPAVMQINECSRVIVFSFGSRTSGIPRDWAATANTPGVNFLSDLSVETVRRIARSVLAVRKSGDIVVASIHWGENWSYSIPREQIRFAHQLIDDAAIDVVHGHSSHHPKGIEVYQQRPIIYGCGDFINDYEGIRGYEEYRDDLALMYFVTLNTTTRKLVHFEMVPTQIKRFRVNHATPQDRLWLTRLLNREGRKFGTRVNLDKENRLTLTWK